MDGVKGRNSRPDVRECRGKKYGRHLYDHTQHKQCPECNSLAKLQWQKDNPEKRANAVKDYYASEPYKKKGRALARSKNGWAEGMVEAARYAQDCKCYLCQTELQPDKPSSTPGEFADHCHDRLVPRGLLCRTCNMGTVGFYEKRIRPLGGTCPVLDDYIDRDWAAHWRELGFDLERP